jgi:hypothetical protein
VADSTRDHAQCKSQGPAVLRSLHALTSQASCLTWLWSYRIRLHSTPQRNSYTCRIRSHLETRRLKLLHVFAARLHISPNPYAAKFPKCSGHLFHTRPSSRCRRGLQIIFHLVCRQPVSLSTLLASFGPPPHLPPHRWLLVGKFARVIGCFSPDSSPPFMRYAGFRQGF